MQSPDSHVNPGLKPDLPAPLLPAAVQANRLLAVLPRDALERLLPHLEQVRLAAGQVLYDASVELGHAYFPIDTIVTLMLPLASHSKTKLAMIGREGVVGISVFMGGGRPHDHAVVLNKGDAFKLPAAVLKAEFDRNGAAMRLLLRFTQTLVTQMAQTAVCNRHHVVEQQLCSWLLSCMDRLSQDNSRSTSRPNSRPNSRSYTPPNSVAVTQAMVADMLGVRREAVSDAAGTLRQLGLIAFRRGRISLLDRPGLQARACECYQVVKRETTRLLPDRPAT